MCRLTELLEATKIGPGGDRGINHLVLVSEEWSTRVDQFVKSHLNTAGQPQASCLLLVQIQGRGDIFGNV